MKDRSFDHCNGSGTSPPSQSDPHHRTRAILLRVGPGSQIAVRDIEPPHRVRHLTVVQAFGLRGPWDDHMLREVLDDVTSVVVHQRGLDEQGIPRVDISVDIPSTRR